MRTFLKQVVDSYYQTRWGRVLLKLTSQSIGVQIEDFQVDALEQLARNFACQRTLSHKVRRGRLVLPNHAKGANERTGQLVVAELKVLHVDELAQLGGDRSCQCKRGRFLSKW
jgi:hypothetical protein